MEIIIKHLCSTCLGEVISTKFEEVNAIILAHDIQVDNPISVLNQDDARSFHASDAKKKYSLFRKATNLDQTETNYIRALENCNKATSIWNRKNDVSFFWNLNLFKETHGEIFFFWNLGFMHTHFPARLVRCAALEQSGILSGFIMIHTRVRHQLTYEPSVPIRSIKPLLVPSGILLYYFWRKITISF